MGVPDIVQVPRIYRGYPAEKPEQVAEVLIRQSTVSSELVIDPFMGSASTGTAALKLGRRFMGSDISDEAVAIARDRIRACQARLGGQMVVFKGARRLYDWLREQQAGKVVSYDEVMRVAHWTSSSLQTYLGKNKIAPFLQPLPGRKLKVLISPWKKSVC